MFQHDDDPARTAEVIRMLVPTLARREIPITPINYTIWYEYFLGTLPELNEILDKVKTNRLPYTPELAQQLYQRFFITDREETIERVGSEARGLFSNMADRFDAAGDELSTFLNQLESVESELGACGQSESLGSRIKTLMKNNEEMNQELAHSVEEMDRLKEELEEARRRAACDPLTGIPNRETFMKRLQRALLDENNDNGLHSVVMVDIDHFKAFNDDYGHLVGDKVIKFVASALTNGVKGSDLVARYGGEEFCILFEETNLENATSVADQIRQKIEISKMSRSDSGEELRPVTVSMGVADSKRGDSPETLLERADKALYVSKEQGRNRVTASDGG